MRKELMQSCEIYLNHKTMVAVRVEREREREKERENKISSKIGR